MFQSYFQSTARKTTLFLLLQLSGAALGALLMHRILGPEAALSFALAGALATLSFVSLGLVLRMMFLKKSIALLALVIVFKWPILIYLLLLVMKSFEVHFEAFAAGSMTWLPATLIWHFITNSEE